MNFKITLFLFGALFNFTTILAQEKPVLPQEFFQMKGEWSVVVEEPTKDGAWKRNEATSASISGLLDDTFLKEEVTLKSTNGTVHMYIIIGVDPRSEEFRVLALDKEFGTMDVYNGNYEDHKLLVTNLGDTGFPVGEGKSMHFRLTYTLPNKGKMNLGVDYTMDKGTTWAPFQKVAYTKSK